MSHFEALSLLTAIQMLRMSTPVELLDTCCAMGNSRLAMETDLQEAWDEIQCGRMSVTEWARS